VDWFEIISENFMVDGGRALATLDRILDQYRVVQHGVSMYFGSAEPFNREHLRRLKTLVKRTKTPRLSDHLCWGSVNGRYTHDLLPMPYTFEAAEVTARKIREARDFLEVPIAMENVSSYAEFHVSEMNEWQFLNEVVERADCGILLDVNNIYVSSQNHDFDPSEYIDAVPAERVAQIHIAGHSKFERYILDTHDHPVIDASGSSMTAPSAARAQRRPCSNGTTAFRRSTKCMPKPARRRNSLPHPADAPRRFLRRNPQHSLTAMR